MQLQRVWHETHFRHFSTSAVHNFILAFPWFDESEKETFPHFKSVWNIGELPKHLHPHTHHYEITLGYSSVKACSISVCGTTDLKPIPDSQYWLNNCGRRRLETKAATIEKTRTRHRRIWDVGDTPWHYFQSPWSLTTTLTDNVSRELKFPSGG